MQINEQFRYYRHHVDDYTILDTLDRIVEIDNLEYGNQDLRWHLEDLQDEIRGLKEHCEGLENELNQLKKKLK